MFMYVISRFHDYGAVPDTFRLMLRLISGKMMRLFEDQLSYVIRNIIYIVTFSQ